VPYSDDRELLMDILKYGAEVEVIAPEVQRAAVEKAHETVASQYRSGVRGLSGFENGDD
jgi:predicted DNA-binding transcriptional regulator YafY